jgi:putative ABC transport system permease protein
MTESAALGTLGGLLGVLLAFWALSALVALLPANLSGMASVTIDPRALAFALALSLLTAVVFGLAPALQASRASQWDALKGGGRTSGEGAGAHVLRGAFVAGEVALALTLLVGAGLLIRSFARLTSVGPGFRSENLLTLGVSLPSSRYGEAGKQVAFFEAAISRIEALPGVVAAGAISFLPLAGPGAATGFKVDGLPEPPAGEEPVADVRAVTRDYLRAMDIPLRRGRFFDERDTADAAVRKVVVDETLAERFWPGQDPLGGTLVMSWGEPVRGEIVGVVADIRLSGLDSPSRSTLYWHLPQLPYSRMTLLLRTDGPPEAVLGAVRAQIAALDPEQPVSQIRTMQDVVARSVQQPRFTVHARDRNPVGAGRRTRGHSQERSGPRHRAHRGGRRAWPAGCGRPQPLPEQPAVRSNAD